MSFNDHRLQLFFSLLVGSISGFISGLLGVTGSVVVLPLAILFGIFENYKTAIGTILFTSDPFQSIFAVIEYAKKKQIDYFIALFLFVGYLSGAYIGAKYNKNFTEKTLKYMTSIILFSLSLYIFYDAYNRK